MLAKVINSQELIDILNMKNIEELSELCDKGCIAFECKNGKIAGVIIDM